MPPDNPMKNGCEDNWTWSYDNGPQQVVLCGPNDRTVFFHPTGSRGTAAIIGTRPLNHGRFYWELHVSERVFGTSIMFGIATKYTRLHTDKFCNLLGEDKHGWGLSHKGILWHRGRASFYTKSFRENEATVIGILFDGIQGTLTYYKDGVGLGVAFRGLDKVKNTLYPAVSSSVAKTEITLKCTRRDFVNLQDRCKAAIINHIRSQEEITKLNLPTQIIRYLTEEYRKDLPWRQVEHSDFIIDF